jgi:ubiquitin carboxyl-terminal hydrolase 16/45
MFLILFNSADNSLKKCNGVNKSDDEDDDDAPLLKKTFEPSESIINNVERSRRPPRVCFILYS